MMQVLKQPRSGLPERALPHNKEAEVAFLGAILLDGVGASDAMALLEPIDFFLPFHRVIFRTLKTLKAVGKPTNDLVLLHDALHAAGEFELAGGAYISTLSEGIPKVANLPHYAEIIRTCALARRCIHQFDANIDLLLTANGDLGMVLREIDSAHIGMEFGQKESSNLFRTAADLTEESSVAEFVVKPYVLAGAVTELVAKIKAGKTTYILAEIARGALEKGSVVYLTEQPATSFRVALERASLLGNENFHILPFNAVLGMEWPAIARIALEQCVKVGAVLLVIDTLGQFCGLDGDSENDSGSATASMKPLQEIASKGIAVLTVRHERKSGGEIGDSGRGSSAFGGAADTLLSLRRPAGNSRPTIRKIECVSRFDGLPAEAIYEFIEGRYQYLGTESEISDREAEELVLGSAPASEEKAKSLDEMLDGSKVARTTAQRVAKRLSLEGRLTQTGKGKKGSPFRYFLTEKDSAQTTPIYGQKEFEGQGEGQFEV